MMMKRRFALVFVFSFYSLLSMVGCSHIPVSQVPRDNVTVASVQGQMYLGTPQTNKTAFLTLSRYFVTQQNLAYCGVASSVMVLNALVSKPEQRPVEKSHKPYRYFTQDNIFTFAQDKLRENKVSQDRVLHHGMTLGTLVKILRAYDLHVRSDYASDSSVDKFRNTLKEVFLSSPAPHQYVLVNYGRKKLDQKGGGHISPLGAYDPIHDAVLIMDVARYKYAPTWVSVTRLFNAMNTEDSDSQRSRGYCVVST